jgi:hypothetical protein
MDKRSPSISNFPYLSSISGAVAAGIVIIIAIILILLVLFLIMRH